MQTAVGSWSSQSTVNETATINTAGHTLVNSTNACNFANPVISVVLNATNTVISTANYTLTGNVVTNHTGINLAGAKITYTYTYGGEACIATQTTAAQFVGIVPMVGLLLVIVLIGLVIGVLIYGFMGGRQKA